MVVLIIGILMGIAIPQLAKNNNQKFIIHKGLILSGYDESLEDMIKNPGLYKWCLEGQYYFVITNSSNNELSIIEKKDDDGKPIKCTDFVEHEKEHNP